MTRLKTGPFFKSGVISRKMMPFLGKSGISRQYWLKSSAIVLVDMITPYLKDDMRCYYAFAAEFNPKQLLNATYPNIKVSLHLHTLEHPKRGVIILGISEVSESFLGSGYSYRSLSG